MSESQVKAPDKRVSLADMARAAAQRTSSRPPPPVAPNVPPSGSSLSSLASAASPPNAPSAGASPQSAPTSYDDDSGIVNLHKLQVASSVDPATVNVPRPQAEPRIASFSGVVARPADDLEFPRPRRRAGPVVVGLLIAAAGIGAAYAIITNRQALPAQQEASPAAEPAAMAAQPAQPKADPQTPTAKAATPVAAAPAQKAGARPVSGPAVAARDTRPVDKTPEPAKPVAAPEPKGNDSQDPLAGAIAKAAGPVERPKTDDAPRAAAQTVGADVPDAPGKGAVQSAIAGPRGVARTCLDGATAPATVSVIFGSDGKVQSVNVTGAGSAADCIKKAFARANVGPFRRTSFSANVTVSPP